MTLIFLFLQTSVDMLRDSRMSVLARVRQFRYALQKATQ